MKLFLLFLRAHFGQRPLRMALTILGVALGVSASVAVRAANVEVLRGFGEAVEAVAGPATLQVSAGELGMDELVVPRLRAHPDIVSVLPVIEQGARLIGGLHHGEGFLVLGFDLLEVAEGKTFRFRDNPQGDTLLDPLLAGHAVFLGHRLAAEWAATAGAPLTILIGSHQYQVQVRGIIESDRGVASAWDRVVIMDIAAAQSLLGLVGRLDRIDLITSPQRPVAEVQAAVQELVPPGIVVHRPGHRSRQVEDMVRAFQLNLTMLSAVGLLVGVFLIYNTISFAVAQRRREIGILRALGMSEAGVCGVFLTEAAMMGVVGGLLGGGLGLVLAHSLVALLSRSISDLYVSMTMVQGSGMFTIEPVLSALVGGILVGGMMSVAGALGPSLEASRTMAAQAIAPGGYEVSQQGHARSLSWAGCVLLGLAGLLAIQPPLGGLPIFGYGAMFCLLVGLSCLAPLLIGGPAIWPFRTKRPPVHTLNGAIWSIAAEQTARSPGRNGVTVSALMVGLAILVGVGVMIRSFRHTVEIWIQETVIADVIVAPTSWLQGDQGPSLAKTLPASWRESLSSVEGVAAVDTYRDLRMDIQGRPAALVSRDLQLHAERSRYLFTSGDSKEALIRTVDEEGVILSEALANRLGLVQGDSLPLMTPEGERRFQVIGVFYDYATDGGKVVMDRALYRRLWHDEGVTVFPIYLLPHADVETVRRRIAARLAGDAAGGLAPVLISNRELRQEILAIFDRTFSLTYVLEIIAVIIAALGIVNTLVTSVLERQRELATLRAIGASENQIRNLVLWEAAYLGALGAVLGVLAGVLLSLILIKVINKQSFGWTIQLVWPIGVLIEAVVLALIAALVAGYVPARWASKQSIVDGLRYE